MIHEWQPYFRYSMQGIAPSNYDKMTALIAGQTKMVTLLFFP
jgi:hypothetical protein